MATTVPGGYYLGPDGTAHDSEGRPVTAEAKAAYDALQAAKPVEKPAEAIKQLQAAKQTSGSTPEPAKQTWVAETESKPYDAEGRTLGQKATK